MATLIPAFSQCEFETAGERRFAERVSKLNDQTICWCNVPIGANSLRPDCILIHPKKGLLVLEVKDWRLEIVEKVDPQNVTIRTESGPRGLSNPLETARRYALAVIGELRRDERLVHLDGPYKGTVILPWSFGVVLSNITRRQFVEAGLGAALPSERVICRDEMAESIHLDEFERRVWAMIPPSFSADLSWAQIDRVRWHLYPEVRIPSGQTELFASLPVPDLLQVMDLTQEQLARSLHAGHRVIHGVAGSGKTVILLHRVAHLAKGVTKPILVICYNEALARWLKQTLEARGVGDKVETLTFHRWCRTQLLARHIGLPPEDEDKKAYFDELVKRAVDATAAGLIPTGQYSAVFIDEGHDFRPEWLKLLAQMVDPGTKSLLIAYDDAQSIYAEGRQGSERKFSFRSVGIEAVGRTTVLRINYRNTDEIIHFARDVAQRILTPSEASEDGVPVLFPQCAGRRVPQPRIERLRDLREEADFILNHFKEAHRSQVRWRDMAVIFRNYKPVGETVLHHLRSHGVPAVYFRDATFGPDEDKVVVVTMHSCKGLEFPLVAIPGVDRMQSEDQELSIQEARLLYVAMTRATKELLLTGC